MENKLNLPLKKKKNEAESPRLDPLMRALKALHSAGAPEAMTATGNPVSQACMPIKIIYAQIMP